MSKDTVAVEVEGQLIIGLTQTVYQMSAVSGSEIADTETRQLAGKCAKLAAHKLIELLSKETA